jgi:hypothetical protein
MKPKPLSKEDIVRAIASTHDNKEAARYLNCTCHHFKTYGKIYKNDDGISLFDANNNRGGKGKKRLKVNNKDTYIIIKQLINGIGKPIKFEASKIKEVLVRECYLEQKCYHCGMDDERIFDFKKPLLVNFKDGKKTNYKLENLEFLCYNSYFINVGDVLTESEINSMENFIPAGPKLEEIIWEISPEQMEILNN